MRHPAESRAGRRVRAAEPRAEAWAARRAPRAAMRRRATSRPAGGRRAGGATQKRGERTPRAAAAQTRPTSPRWQGGRPHRSRRRACRSTRRRSPPRTRTRPHFGPRRTRTARRCRAYVLNTPTSGREDGGVPCIQSTAWMHGLRIQQRQRSTCPLKRWLEDQNASSASSVQGWSTSPTSPPISPYLASSVHWSTSPEKSSYEAPRSVFCSTT